MTTPNKIALFAPIEADLKNINSNNLGYTRLYEAEALKCFRCWRKNGGFLADIPIYAICPSRNVISPETKKALEKLNVKYIEVYFEETDQYECGFWNIPLVGKWAEENLDYDILIKIDLDLYLIKELPKDLIEHAENTEDIIGIHDHLAHEYLSTLPHKRYIDFYNTGITITKRSRGFFHLQYQYLFKMLGEFNKAPEMFNKKYGLVVSKEISKDSGVKFFEYNLLEELCVSILFEESKHPVYPLRNYCLETKEFELDGEVEFDLDKIYFVHEHIDNSDAASIQMNKIRYAKIFGKHNGFKYFFEYR